MVGESNKEKVVEVRISNLEHLQQALLDPSFVEYTEVARKLRLALANLERLYQIGQVTSDARNDRRDRILTYFEKLKDLHLRNRDVFKRLEGEEENFHDLISSPILNLKVLTANRNRYNFNYDGKNNFYLGSINVKELRSTPFGPIPLRALLFFRKNGNYFMKVGRSKKIAIKVIETTKSKITKKDFIATKIMYNIVLHQRYFVYIADKNNLENIAYSFSFMLFD